MAKPEWGTKRTCQSCGARFYDLRRDPIVCPVCSASFDPDRNPRVKRGGPAVKDEAVAVTSIAAAKGAHASDVDGVEVGKEADDAEEVGIDEIEDTADDADSDLETADDENNDLMEDTSELGEDDDDIGEVMEHVNDDLDENL